MAGRDSRATTTPGPAQLNARAATRRQGGQEAQQLSLRAQDHGHDETASRAEAPLLSLPAQGQSYANAVRPVGGSKALDAGSGSEP